MIKQNSLKDQIDNIIFDLGGVILNIHYEKTIALFSELSGKDVAELYTQHHQVEVFSDYEKGLISSEAFRSEMRKLLGESLTDQQIDDAWNAMLLDFPQERLELIENLSNRYNVFVLSNTNAIHIDAFHEILDDQIQGGRQRFYDTFIKVYYSYEMQDRKPHASIYQQVIDEQSLDPSKTLFIDDTAGHLQGAQEAGLHTYHLKVKEQSENIHQLLGSW